MDRLRDRIVQHLRTSQIATTLFGTSHRQVTGARLPMLDLASSRQSKSLLGAFMCFLLGHRFLTFLFQRLLGPWFALTGFRKAGPAVRDPSDERSISMELQGRARTAAISRTF